MIGDVFLIDVICINGNILLLINNGDFDGDFDCDIDIVQL